MCGWDEEQDKKKVAKKEKALEIYVGFLILSLGSLGMPPSPLVSDEVQSKMQ